MARKRAELERSAPCWRGVGRINSKIRDATEKKTRPATCLEASALTQINDTIGKQPTRHQKMLGFGTSSNEPPKPRLEVKRASILPVRAS